MKSNLWQSLVSSVICVAALTVPSPAKANQNFLIQYGVDRPGMDYRRFAVNRMEDCLNACLRDGQCRAFTYVSTGYQPPDRNNQQPLCWLKNDVPSANWQSGMISGVRQ
jgi:hypothetical protein